MKVVWAFDRGSRRESHEVVVAGRGELDGLLTGIHGQREPVVVTLFDADSDPDELPTGLQVGLGHPGHAFAVRIADDGGYLSDPLVTPPADSITFDAGGVPTEYAPSQLMLRPRAAIEAALAFAEEPTD